MEIDPEISVRKKYTSWALNIKNNVVWGLNVSEISPVGIHTVVNYITSYLMFPGKGIKGAH